MERPFSSVASFQALSCCECAGGAVSTTRASATSGKLTLLGSASKNSTGRRIPGCKNFSAGPKMALGISTCSKVSGFMNVHVPSGEQEFHDVPLDLDLFQKFLRAEMRLPHAMAF